MDTGRRMDVHIEGGTRIDQRTGVEVPSYYYIITADYGHEKNIKAVEGVETVTTYTATAPNKYFIYIDKRYDCQVVLRNIEAAILCNEPEG